MVTEIKLNNDLTNWEILQLRDFLNGLLHTRFHFGLGTKDNVGTIEFFDN